METDEFIKSLIRDLKSAQWPEKLQATLILSDQPLSTGIFSLDSERCGQGTLQPIDGSNLDRCPEHRAILKLSERNGQLVVRNFRRCRSALANHWHFDFEVSAS